MNRISIFHLPPLLEELIQVMMTQVAMLAIELETVAGAMLRVLADRVNDSVASMPKGSVGWIAVSIQPLPDTSHHVPPRLFQSCGCNNNCLLA